MRNGSKWRCQVCEKSFLFPTIPAQTLLGCPLYLKESFINARSKKLKPCIANYVYCEECSQLTHSSKTEIDKQ